MSKALKIVSSDEGISGYHAGSVVSSLPFKTVRTLHKHGNGHDQYENEWVVVERRWYNVHPCIRFRDGWAAGIRWEARVEEIEAIAHVEESFREFERRFGEAEVI